MWRRDRPSEERLFRLMVQPLAIDEAARLLAVDDAGILPLTSWVSTANEATAIDRVALYARMHFGRVRDSLREDFPTVAYLLGEPAFDGLVVDYLSSHPSRRSSLRELGRRLPGFIASHGCASWRADLADIALLEWMRLEAFDASVGAPLTEADFVALARGESGDLTAARFCLAPGTCLLELEHAVLETWLAVDRGDTVRLPEPRPTCVLVWRRGFAVRHRAVSGSERSALVACAAGCDLAGISEAFSVGRDAGDAAMVAVSQLRQWLCDELLVLEAA